MPTTATIPRRGFLLGLAGLPAVASELVQTPAPPNPIHVILDSAAPLFEAPSDPQAWPAFHQALLAWRQTQRHHLSYEDSLYQRPDFAWTADCYCCGFLMLFDQTVYDHREHRYLVDTLLHRARIDFGGFDAVVLWHAYPRIGTDDRNQFEFYRDMPEGILGLRRLIRQFHEHDVRVFLNYNPWDTGTRREPRNDAEALALMIQALDADGLFLDTLDQGWAGFRQPLDAARPGVALESELALPVDRVHDHHLSWAQGFADSLAPGVLRNKWFEPRHQQHLIQRWNHDHSGEIHTAWMNGTGILVWENVFGSWIEWSPRDRSLLRAVLPIQRRYSRLFTGQGWTPLVPTAAPHLFASCWEASGLRLWTVVNRSDNLCTGSILSFHPSPNARHLDLIHGTPARITALKAGAARWETRLGARGVACLLEGTPESLGNDLDEFLGSQRRLAHRATTDTHVPPRVTRRLAVQVTRRSRRAPAGMIAISGGALTLRTTLRVRECGFYESVPAPPLSLASSYAPSFQSFERQVTLEPYAIDSTPVTNAEFARFLVRSGYRPDPPQNFLKHWGHGHPPAGQEDHPVVWVSLEDARAYAHWAGKRLPTEWEWQHAAQGHEGLRYPWGPDWLPDRCNDGTSGQHTTAVTAFPEGRSRTGIWDLCGNTWEWTESEHTDSRTRFCLLKGGSFYRASGSNWYFEGGPQTNQHAAKFLLLWPGLDRCATIGFRCAADLRST